MAPTRRTIRGSPATTTTTTPVTNAQLKAVIDQGVTDALAARDADRSRNGDDSHISKTGSRRTERTTRECTYTDFLRFQPMNFKGTEGFVGLTQWFERMETVFNINNCALVRMPLTTCLMKMMTAKYCPRNEIKKLEIEISELKVKGAKTMQDAVKFATELMDKKIHTFAKRESENKRKEDVNQQQQNKWQNTGRAYTFGPVEKPYEGSKPMCSKCNYHHDGSCAPKCNKCNRVVHLARDCRSPAATNNQRNLTCYECGNQGHYRSDCLELKNQNHGNQARGIGARRMVHALGAGETNQDRNNIEDDIYQINVL
nr:hypothetical protein [Tanacetum cinerariifolium]